MASSGVPKAAETVWAVPLTGSRLLPNVGVPTVRPNDCSVELTDCTSRGLGPYAAANWAEVR